MLSPPKNMNKYGVGTKLVGRHRREQISLATRGGGRDLTYQKH